MLKEPRVGKNIPTVAALTQGEVVKFASDAAAAMGSDGCHAPRVGGGANPHPHSHPHPHHPHPHPHPQPHPHPHLTRCNVLIEGREQTLNYVRTVHRLELALS